MRERFTSERSKPMRELVGGSLMFGTVVLVGANLAGAVDSKEAERIQHAATVLNEVHANADKDVPDDLWKKAACVVVVPSVKKGAFIFGGEYGRGLMSCRHSGAWSGPVFMSIEKGSFGLQIGGEETDLLLLVMNERGMQKLLGDKVTLGAEASAAAGPVGRNARAETDAQLHAEILSYSRSQGAFVGLDLSGGVLKPDVDATHDLYGKGVTAKTVLMTTSIKAPAAADPFMNALNAR
jgi:lipid-binding SYLF domain-containing protein